MRVIRNEKGFTLMELVLVIVVLGILSAVAIVAFGPMSTSARDGAIDGAFASYQSGLAISVGLCRGFPPRANAIDADGCDSTSNDFAGSFGEDVVTQVTLSGGLSATAYAPATGTFNICSGTVAGGGRMATATYTVAAGVGTLALAGKAIAAAPCT
ncbi:MAG: type II secretion system protein [Nitrospiria bacterium]